MSSRDPAQCQARVPPPVPELDRRANDVLSCHGLHGRGSTHDSTLMQPWGRGGSFQWPVDDPSGQPQLGMPGSSGAIWDCLGLSRRWLTSVRGFGHTDLLQVNTDIIMHGCRTSSVCNKSKLTVGHVLGGRDCTLQALPRQPRFLLAPPFAFLRCKRALTRRSHSQQELMATGQVTGGREQGESVNDPTCWARGGAVVG